MSDDRSVLIAVGGNALIGENEDGTIAQQAANARRTAARIAAIAQRGWRTVVTHGNGPQVGFILLRSESVPDDARLPKLTLDMCVADSQGGIGHLLVEALSAELAALGSVDRVAYLLTHTVVDPEDPAFSAPTKPIGPAYDAAAAEERRTTHGWTMVEESGRGFRRVVPSPRPLRIVETEQVRTLLNGGYVVLAAGGGGIPVAEESPGTYRSLEAVIDKDLASARLALSLGLRRFAVCTGVEQVAVDFGTPDQRNIDRMTASEARGHLADGQFPAGSMGPKVEAALEFLEGGGREVLITSPESLERAFDGETGTRIVPDP